jgi:hypothetical protein
MPASGLAGEPPLPYIAHDSKTYRTIHFQCPVFPDSHAFLNKGARRGRPGEIQRRNTQVERDQVFSASEYRFCPGATALLLTFISLASACLGQPIKKRTRLVLPTDQMAFEVAQAKNNAGAGNGAAMAILTGVALGLSAYGGTPAPDLPAPVDHSDDPNWDPNLDPTTPLSLEVGMRCRTRVMDKVTVLSTDTNRVLVEVSRDHYSYPGPDQGTAVLPTVAETGLDFAQIDNTPACLNKTRLWMETSVFVALRSLVPPEVKKAVKGNAKGKASKKRAEEGAEGVEGNQ